MVDKKRAKGTGAPDPTLQLVEIETHINKILKFLQLCKSADSTSVSKIMRSLQGQRKTERMIAQNELSLKMKEEQNRIT